MLKGLVRFKSTLSLLQLVQVENLISQKLGIKADLVTEGALKNRILKEIIQHDLQIIYDSTRVVKSAEISKKPNQVTKKAIEDARQKKGTKSLTKDDFSGS